MDISFGPSTVYPVPVTIALPGIPKELTAVLTDRISSKAWERVSDYLRAREAEVSGSVDSDPLLRDLGLLVQQYTTAQANLDLIAKESLSTAENVKYAGGIESSGNRIFSAEEVARNALETIGELENRSE